MQEVHSTVVLEFIHTSSDVVVVMNRLASAVIAVATLRNIMAIYVLLCIIRDAGLLEYKLTRGSGTGDIEDPMHGLLSL